MDYRVAFDLSRDGFHGWWFGLFGLFFGTIGVILVRESSAARPAMRRLSYFFIGFALFWTTLAVGMPYMAYRDARARLESGAASTVEGPVEDFKPMPYTGHALESFTVKGIRFSYSDYVITGGFNRSRAHGGPIREGLPVKISYGPKREILRLEIPASEPYSAAPPGPSGIEGKPFILFLVIMLGLPAVGLFRRWQERSGVPPYEPSALLFRESMVSGRSLRTWWTRIAGANNALEVALTKDALFIDLIMPFRLFSWLGLSDFKHTIPLHSLMRADKKELPGWQKWAASGVESLELEYRRETGEVEVFVLYLSRRDELHAKLVELKPQLGKPA